jgi:hypothetical protein
MERSVAGVRIVGALGLCAQLGGSVVRGQTGAALQHHEREAFVWVWSASRCPGTNLTKAA